MKRLLHVLGGGPWQVPTVRLAKELGYDVLVTDMYRDRPAYEIADYYEIVDITDWKATLGVAERYRIDGILCDTTDTGVATAAYVAEALDLPGIGLETALNFTDKGRMRERTSAAGCDIPGHFIVHSEMELTEATKVLGFPVIIKPVDSQAGAGVSRVESENQLFPAFLRAREKSRRSGVLIEAYIVGEEYIIDGFMLDGEPHLLGIAHKFPNTDNPTIADRITYSPLYNNPVRRLTEFMNRRVMLALGLQNGIFHGEYRLRGEQVFPIDIAARGGGCMIYTHVLPNISGVNVNQRMIKLAMGESIDIQAETSRAANIEYLQLPMGIIERINGMNEAHAISGIIASYLGVGPGSHIKSLLEKNDRPGYMIAVADTANEAIQRTLDAVSQLQVIMAANNKQLEGT